MDVTAQERVTATLGAFFFLLPFLFGKRTEFVVFYMRQSFFLFLVVLLFIILANFLSFFSFYLLALVNFIVFCIILFLMWKAYTGEKFALPYIYDASVRLIKNIKLEELFSPEK